MRDAGTFGDILDDDGSKVDPPIAEVLGNITALIGSMASPPREPLVPFQESMLGDAILMAWERKRTDTRIDDVQAALYELAEEKEKDRRISDIAAQLNKYCSTGIYGDVFNKPSQLDPAIHITTLELDGFPDSVLRPVIFALMVAINQQMYLSGNRSTRKMCIIEEAWSLMSGANVQTREFINTGYRTVRKFGGSFCTVTQGIEDFFQNEESLAAFNNSDIHITLRQGEGVREVPQGQPETLQPVRADHDQELSASPGRRTLLRHDQGWFLHLLPPYLRRPMVAGDALHRAEGIRILRKPDATRYTADGGYRADRHALQRPPRNGRVCRHPGPLPT